MVQWFAVRQRLWQAGKLRQPRKQRLEVAKEVSNQAVGQVALQAGKTIDKFPKAELVVVKRIDQVPHGLDALAKLRAVLAKARRGKITRRERGVHGIAGQLSAAQRQENAGGKHRIEKREGVPGQDQPARGAVLRAIGILSGHPILPDLPAGREMLLDPSVVLHLATKD